MNNFIIPVEQSSHPVVAIELFDEKNELVATKEENGKRIIYIDDFTGNSDAQFGQDKKLTLLYKVKLKRDDDLKDLQYTMDLKVTPELDDDELKKLTGDEARMQARFTSSSKGCNDYRAHGKGGDDGLNLEIVVPSSIYKLKDLNDHIVDLVAVWACGHEAITLTRSIIFLPRIGSEIDTGATAEGNSLGHTETEPEPPLAEDTPNDVPEDYEAGEQLEQTLNHRHHQESDKSGLKNSAVNDNHTTKKHHAKGKNEEDSYATIRKFNAKYNDKEFGAANFTANSYIVGLLVFIFIGGTVINAFLAMSNRPRRDTAKLV